MRHFRAFVAACLALAAPLAAGVAQEAALPTVILGAVTDGPILRAGSLLDALGQEIQVLAAQDFEVRIPDDKLVPADFTVAGVNTALDRLLADPEVDLVVAAGPLASHVAIQRRDLPKPLVALTVLDEDWQQAPRDGTSSGVANLNYILTKSERDLVGLTEVLPFTRVTTLLEAALIEAMPDAVAKVQRDLSEYGFESTLVGVGASIDDVAARIPPDTEVVYITPLLQISDEQFSQLMTQLTAAGFPTLSWWGEREVRLGALAGRTPTSFDQRFVRRGALNIQRILLGDDAGTLPVDFQATVRVTLNMQTAATLGFDPGWRILTEAELIGIDEVIRGREISIYGAVQEAVDANLDLRVQEQVVLAGAEDVRLARAPRLPQIGARVDGSWIDADRAEATRGILPEYALTVSGGLRQVIYNDSISANVDVQESLQESREFDRDALELDIRFEAAVTYLRSLRAEALERIQRENLLLTRTNLETAQLRVNVGTASAGEIFRWRNKIAGDRQRVVDAGAGRRVADIQLNRLLNRPLDEPFETTETPDDDPNLATIVTRLSDYLANRRGVAYLAAFMAQEGFRNSPELQAISALAVAQERRYLSTRRAFWLPDFNLEADLTWFAARGGAGSEQREDAMERTGVDAVNWFVGANAIFPLYTGNERAAARDQASLELQRLDFTRRATVQRIDEAVRSAIERVQAAYAGTVLTEEAAEAARRNYELVETEYGRGTASILQLLDAQNASLVAEEAAADAFYQFRIELMSADRASGAFNFLATPAEIDAFLDRLDQFRLAQQQGSQSQ